MFEGFEEFAWIHAREDIGDYTFIGHGGVACRCSLAAANDLMLLGCASSVDPCPVCWHVRVTGWTDVGLRAGDMVMMMHCCGAPEAARGEKRRGSSTECFTLW